MYRRRYKGSQKINERMRRWREAREQKRLDGPARHEFVLLRSDRIDCYRVAVDGQLLPGRMGWARILELIRKTFLRATTRVFE